MPTEAMRALYEGDAERARALLAADEQLTAPEAAAFGRIDRLRELLAAGKAANAWSDDGFSALHLAVFGRQEDAVRLLIEHGADLEAPSRHETMSGIRPLHTAVFVRAPRLVELLLEAGADVNSREEGRETALLNAAQNGDVEVARVLLAHGADPSLGDRQGRRPLDLARGEVARLLG
jgi:ankyrin repeat protein